MNKKMTFVFLLFWWLFEAGFSQPNYVVKRITIELGPQEHQISPFIDDFGDILIITGVALSDSLDVFVTDGKDNSIKKYNWYGQYQGKIKLPNTKFLEVHCLKNKLYTFDRLHQRNDLYVFDCKTLKLIKKKRQIFSEPFVLLNYAFYDSQIVFSMLNHYNIYDMENDSVYVNQNYPFISKDSLDEEEFRFLTTHVTDTSKAFYLGMINHYFLFFKDTYITNKFEIASIKIKKKVLNKALIEIKRKFDYIELTPFSLVNQVGLLKKRYLFLLGYEENNLLVNIIDLKILFPNVRFPRACLLE